MGKRRSKRIKNCGVHVRSNLTATNVNAITGNSSSSPASPVTSLRNYGIKQGARGIIKTKRLKIIKNPSPAEASKAETQTAFRFNIPTPTRHFKGRRKTMEDVRDYFTNLSPQTDHCWDRIVAIVGLGGMGKTETAYKFAADYKELFPNVAWINSETEKSCLTSFLDLGKHLGVVPKDMKIEDADLNLVKEVYREMDKRDCGRVLLIFDNAIQLNSKGTEFGILNYLPTQDLLNRRFPYILVTTQTDYWERGINKFQVDELTEEESLDFFRSSFQVKAPECDEEFKKLHNILEGYPLVMNLAAAQIDYLPKKDTINHLKQQISNYIEKLVKQQDKILSQKMNRAWANSYNKTLSNVWQLTFERIQQEDDGRDALELLQLMSFLRVPISSHEFMNMLVSSSDCPHPPRKEREFQLKECLRVLLRFYAVRILGDIQDDEMGFECKLGIHRLLQLVVRQQMVSRKILQQVLFYFATNYNYANSVNMTALEEALHKIQLSQPALPYVGILACHGVPAACKIVETTEPQTKAAATIWRLYNLERGMTSLNENAIQVLREIIGLTKSEEQLRDRKSFADVLFHLLDGSKLFRYYKDDGAEVADYFNLAGLEGGLEENWSICRNCRFEVKPQQELKDYVLSSSTANILSKLQVDLYIREDGLNPATDDDVAGIWFTMFTRLKYYQSKWDRWPSFWGRFWRSMYKTCHSPDAPQSRIATLRTCLWNRGLEVKLIQIFGRFTEFHGNDYNPWIVRLMDVCMDGISLRDERIQKVMSSLCHMATTVYAKYTSDAHLDNWKILTVEFCSVWIKLLLTDDNPPSHKLLECLTRVKFLDCVEILGRHVLRHFVQYTPREYRSKYFRQFMERFESSDIEVIRSLVNVCRRFTGNSRQVIPHVFMIPTAVKKRVLSLKKKTRQRQRLKNAGTKRKVKVTMKA